MTPDRPVLIYDGRCGFCRRFIPRWQQLTGERVRYVAAFDGVVPDEAGVSLSPASPASLQRAVHLVLPDGRVFAGAAAVAELGGYTDGVPLFRTLYRHAPGVRPIAELGYRAVASRRVLFHHLTAVLVGPDLRRPRQALTRWLFLRLLGLTALCAVLSWWVQLDGLIGSHGIAPAADYLARASKVAADQGWSALETLRQVPTLAWLGSSDGALHALCALTTLGSLLLVFNVLPGPGLVLTWLGYLSLVSVGGIFMGYQWDALLLESLFVALFVVPWRGLRPGLVRERAPPWAGVWLVRLLVFKLIFLSGWVKLASGDPVWADLSALDYHYWTQPLPTFTSALAADAPAWTRDLGIRVMFAIELVFPFFVFVPLRRLRYLAAFGILALMLGIGLTGNYGYFNLLTCTLTLMCFDDGALRRLVPRRWRSRVPDSHAFPYARPPVPRRVPLGIGAGLLAFLSISTFVLRTTKPDDDPPDLMGDVVTFVAPLHLSSSYGLFATMTTERPEIEMSGSLDGRAWRTYRFAWKPGALDEAPSFAGPHMPRLDWQMWFAALYGDCRRTPWYLAFARRILEGEPTVLGLLADNPFPDGPPRYLASHLWYYTFATPDDPNFWQREGAGRDFCPTLELRQGKLYTVTP